MKLGISSYSFTWATGVKDSIPEKRFNETNLLNTARELELELVQIADNMPLHEMTEEQVHTLCETAGNLQIAIEVGANDLTAANLEHYIHLADKLKSKILRFSIDGKDHKPGVNEVISIVRNAVPELKNRGITLALENHERLLTFDFREIIEAVGNSHVGICLDCANSLGVGEGFREVVTALAPYTVNFHLKEVFIRRKSHMMGFEIEGRPFGEGCLPLQWMLEQLPPTCKTAILEQWTPPEENLQRTIQKERDWAERSIAYLKPYFHA
jgi:sugar phosphate isomerase/epimerase